jgi:hypothetical protein
VKPGSAALPITIAEVELGSEVVRVELKIYSGRPVFSAWRFYNKAGTLLAGRHGLTFSIQHLPEVAAAFVVAVERARAEGLLPDEASA